MTHTVVPTRKLHVIITDFFKYRIEGNFYMVQTFAVFADDPTTAKIKTAKSFNSRIGTALCRALSQK